MLPRENRLVKKEDFARVYKKGHFFSEGPISLKVKKNSQNDSRIGLAVGVKFSKKAVARNRLKRKLREVFKAYLGQIKKGWDIVVIISSGLEEKVGTPALKKIISEILAKGKLFK